MLKKRCSIIKKEHDCHLALAKRKRHSRTRLLRCLSMENKTADEQLELMIFSKRLTIIDLSRDNREERFLSFNLFSTSRFLFLIISTKRKENQLFLKRNRRKSRF